MGTITREKAQDESSLNDLAAAYPISHHFEYSRSHARDGDYSILKGVKGIQHGVKAKTRGSRSFFVKLNTRHLRAVMVASINSYIDTSSFACDRCTFDAQATTFDGERPATPKRQYRRSIREHCCTSLASCVRYRAMDSDNGRQRRRHNRPAPTSDRQDLI